MDKASVFLGVLSGGAGTRLWPVSRKSYPKQFYSLAGKDPLLIETLNRVRDLGSVHILTTKQLISPTTGLLNKYNIQAEVLGEPAAQNTAPIIATFNKIIFNKNPNAILCILPADAAIYPVEKFQSDLKTAIALADEGKIVTFGIPPTSPSTAYGYLKVKDASSSTEVESFAEKPNEEKAKGIRKYPQIAQDFLFWEKILRLIGLLLPPRRASPEWLAAGRSLSLLAS